ncbi:MAG: hypothetical protein ACETVY_05265, partial [Candidatus Bathyarchaeia archaeon]
MKQSEALALMKEIGDRCSLPKEGLEGVLWVEDARNYLEAAEGVAVAISASSLDGLQIFNSIRVAVDNQKEIHVASREEKGLLII